MMENEEPRSKLPGNQGRTPLFSSHPDEDNGGTESESTDRFTGGEATPLLSDGYVSGENTQRVRTRKHLPDKSLQNQDFKQFVRQVGGATAQPSAEQQQQQPQQQQQIIVSQVDGATAQPSVEQQQQQRGVERSTSRSSKRKRPYSPTPSWTKSRSSTGTSQMSSDNGHLEQVAEPPSLHAVSLPVPTPHLPHQLTENGNHYSPRTHEEEANKRSPATEKATNIANNQNREIQRRLSPVQLTGGPPQDLPRGVPPPNSLSQATPHPATPLPTTDEDPLEENQSASPSTFTPVTTQGSTSVEVDVYESAEYDPLVQHPHADGRVPQRLCTAKRFRCCCTLYTVLWALACIVVLIVWYTHISPSRRVNEYVTSLNETMKLPSHSLTAERLLVHAEDAGDLSDVRFSISHEPCNVETTLTTTLGSADIIFHENDTGRLGLTHHVFNMGKNAHLTIDACVETQPDVCLLVFFYVFQSVEDMERYDSDHGSHSPCSQYLVIENERCSESSITFYQNYSDDSCTAFTGHHYFSTQVETIPGCVSNSSVNIAIYFNFTTPRYLPEKLSQCKHFSNAYCELKYTWFPWELFHPWCVFYKIEDLNHAHFDTLLHVHQTSYQRKDMIGYIAATFVVTLLAAWLVHCQPIYRCGRRIWRYIQRF